jgi:hypothetical protein
MSSAIERLATAVLYEGYLLYPYRLSSAKNQHRWMLGTLYPQAFAERQREGDPWWMQTECLVRADSGAMLDVRVRFLQLAAAPVERDVTPRPSRLAELVGKPARISFRFRGAGDDAETPAPDAALEGAVEIAAEPVDAQLFKITARVLNVTPFAIAADDTGHARDRALGSAFASAHTLLTVRGGRFVSLADPPEALRALASRCENVGTWPALVGDPAAADTILSAPIILQDYPAIAPESPGDFFDATEIDEMLTLRVLTMTDAEKGEMGAADPRARTVLARTEALGDRGLARLHGATRHPIDALRPGRRVRLRPARRADILDAALAGKTATIVSLEQDFDGRRFVAVTVEDDPGQDLGASGQPGHRFFFGLDEIELLP